MAADRVLVVIPSLPAPAWRQAGQAGEARNPLFASSKEEADSLPVWQAGSARSAPRNDRILGLVADRTLSYSNKFMPERRGS